VLLKKEAYRYISHSWHFRKYNKCQVILSVLQLVGKLEINNIIIYSILIIPNVSLITIMHVPEDKGKQFYLV